MGEITLKLTEPECLQLLVALHERIAICERRDRSELSDYVKDFYWRRQAEECRALMTRIREGI
jgi:hypothetical protein